MQNVSGGGEENGHGWLKKNEVLRGEVPFKSYWRDSTQVEIDEWMSPWIIIVNRTTQQKAIW